MSILCFRLDDHLDAPWRLNRSVVLDYSKNCWKTNAGFAHITGPRGSSMNMNWMGLADACSTLVRTHWSLMTFRASTQWRLLCVPSRNSTYTKPSTLPTPQSVMLHFFFDTFRVFYPRFSLFHFLQYALSVYFLLHDIIEYWKDYELYALNSYCFNSIYSLWIRRSISNSRLKS